MFCILGYYTAQLIVSHVALTVYRMKLQTQDPRWLPPCFCPLEAPSLPA